MNKFVCGLTALVLLAGWPTHGQSIEEISACVVYLRQESIKTAEIDGASYELWLKLPNTNAFRPFPEVRSGSGVLVAIGERPPHPYLVTASHVARMMSLSALAVLKGPEDNPIAIPLIEIAGTTNLNWSFHDTADVALLPIDLSRPALAAVLQKHFLSVSCFGKELAAPKRDTTLTALGFPLNLGVVGKFSPISKSSIPASGLLTLPRADTKTPTIMFLLQDPSIGGFSGAAVFDLPGLRLTGNALISQGGVRCLGIIHGTFSDDTGGKLALVTPSAFVVEAVEKAERDRRNAGTGQQGAPPNSR